MDTLVSDSSFLIVQKIGVVHLDSALTRDRDGSGYLDAVELHFDRMIDPGRDQDSSKIFFSASIKTNEPFSGW